jgi:hypothetical protein
MASTDYPTPNAASADSLDEWTVVPAIDAMTEWHRARATYCVWMYFFDDPAFATCVDDLVLDLARVVPFVASRLHMTVFVSGFLRPRAQLDDDITWKTVREQIAAVKDERANPPSIRVIGGECTPYGVYLRAQDERDCTNSLRFQLGRVNREIIFGPYFPHITIGHYLERRPLRLVREVVERWQTLLNSIVLRPTRVSLVSIDALTPIRPNVGICCDHYRVIHEHRLESPCRTGTHASQTPAEPE